MSFVVVVENSEVSKPQPINIYSYMYGLHICNVQKIIYYKFIYVTYYLYSTYIFGKSLNSIIVFDERKLYLYVHWNRISYLLRERHITDVRFIVRQSWKYPFLPKKILWNWTHARRTVLWWKDKATANKQIKIIIFNLLVNL